MMRLLLPLALWPLVLWLGTMPALLPAQSEAEAERDRGFLQGLIEDNLSSTARDVRIEGFEGALSSAASVELLTISDEEGIWLRAEGLVLDWDRSALLRRRLEVEQLTADRIEVLRPPIPDPNLPAPEATPFSLPELPLSVQLGELSIGALVLGEPFLGEELVLGIDGQASLANGEGSATLVAVREDGQGRFELSGSYSNETEVLDLTLDVQEEADGLVVNALGIPGAPSLDLTLEGTGPITDYSAELTLATDGTPRVTGQFGLESTPAEGAGGADGEAPLQRTVLVNLEGDLSPLLPATYADFVGDAAQLSVRYLAEPDGSKRVPQLVLQTDSVTLLGDVALGPDNWPTLLDIRGRLAPPDGSDVTVPGGTAIGTATLDLQYDASVSDDFTLSLSAEDIDREDLALDSLTLDGTGTLSPPENGELGALDLVFDYAAEGLEPQDPDLARALGDTIAGQVSLARDGGPVEIRRLTLTGPGIDLDATGSVQGPEESFLTALQAELTAEDLSRFAGLAGRELSGAADVDVDLQLRPLDGAFEIALDGQTTDFALGDERIDPLLAGTATLDLAATRDETGTRLESLEVSTDALSLTAQADITSGASSATFSFVIPDMSVAVPTLEGRVALTGDFTRTEAGDGTLTVGGDVPEGQLELTAELSDPGGDGQQAVFDLVAEIADLEPYAALAERELDGAARLTAEGVTRLDASTFDVTLVLVSTDLAVGLAQVDPLLAGEVALEGRVLRTGETSFRVEDLALASSLLEAAGAVSYGDGEVSTAGLTLSSPNLSPLSALAGRDLSGALRAEVSGSLQTDLALFDLVLDAAATDLVIGDERIDPLLAGEVELSGAVTRTGPLAFEVSDLVLASPLLDASGAAQLEDGRLTTAGLRAAADDLARFSDLAGRPLAGSVEVEVSGRAALDAATLDLVIDASSTDLAIGDDRIDPLLDGEVELSGAVIRSGPLEGAVENLRLVAPAVQAIGDIAVADGIARTEGLSITMPDLSVFSALAGRTLEGQVELDISGEAAIDGATFDLVLDAAGEGLAVGLPGTDPLLDGPVALSGRFARTGPMAFAVEDLDLTSTLVKATGAATLEDGIVETPGISLSVEDLQPLSGFAGRPLDGAVATDVSGSAALDGATFDLTLQARTQDVEVGIDQVDAILAGTGRLDGRVARSGPLSVTAEEVAISTPVLGLTLDAQIEDGLGSGAFDLALTDASVLAPGLSGGIDAQGTIERTGEGQLALDVTGSGPGGVDLAVQATLDPVEDDGALYDVAGTADLSVAQLGEVGRIIGRPLAGSIETTLAGSLRTDLSQADVTFDAIASSLDIGVEAVRPLLAGTGTARGRVIKDGPQILVEDLDVAFPQFSATADSTTGADGATVIEFDARLADLGLFVADFPGAATASGTATLQPSGATIIDVSASGPGGVSVDVNGAVNSDGTLNLDASGSAPLGLANEFIEPARLSGPLTFDLSVDGPPALTSVSGTVRASGARLAVPQLGEAFEGIEASVQLSGGSATIDLSAGLSDGGSIGVSGPVELAAPYSGDLTVRLDGLVLRDPQLYETIANGQLTVTGPLTGGARIAGLIQLGRTEIRVPSGGLGNLGALPEVDHVNAPQDVRSTLARAGLTINGVPVGQNGEEVGGGVGPTYPLDVTVSAPNQIFVRGRGLDAELGGEITIGGTTAEVIPQGQFELVRGRLDILSQRFVLDEGLVSIAGDFDPYLRFVAVTETGDGTTVRIVLDGPVSNLEVNFESSPQLPEDEVLARLLFGRDLTSISPLQAVQLAAAVSTLTGGGPGVLDRFREGLGLDDLDIATDEEGGVAVRAGRYLSENVYTDVQVGESGAEATINLDLTQDVTVRGAVSSEGQSSLGVFFERDY